ncbi:hypothetical protein [Rhodoplanes sp. Z2-YC6860]|uniref:hypothetical protein n=1 Tax=Rhodoplanes sp. Z2-YC6860 TaxID=674703 RepID=UPI00082EDC12|nr:hypothetical protein [Rhodoplanes sp. Z2-YC6860]
MLKGVWTAAGTACVMVLLASSGAPVQATSLAVHPAPKHGAIGSTARTCNGACAVEPPRYYYRAYRPYYSQYDWRPHYTNTIVSDRPFHAQPAPWWETDDAQRYAIGPAYGY